MAKRTKTVILDAAEHLFAKQGFNQTSLRTITQYASVNLASVNYHFGSKKNLIQAVFKRYFDALIPGIEDALSNYIPSQGTTGLLDLFNTIIPSMLSLDKVSIKGASTFAALLGKGYTETQGHLRFFIMQHYGSTVHKIVGLIQQCLPHLTKEVIFWRLHFVLGSFVFAMASSQALTEIAQSDYNRMATIRDVIEQLVPFIACGMSGEIENR